MRRCTTGAWPTSRRGAQRGLKISRQAMDKARQGQLFAYADMLSRPRSTCTRSTRMPWRCAAPARGQGQRGRHAPARPRTVLTELRSRVPEWSSSDIDAQTIANRIQQVELDKERIEQRLGWVVMAVLLAWWCWCWWLPAHAAHRKALADRQATPKLRQRARSRQGLGNRHYLQDPAGSGDPGRRLPWYSVLMD